MPSVTRLRHYDLIKYVNLWSYLISCVIASIDIYAFDIQSMHLIHSYISKNVQIPFFFVRSSVRVSYQ